MNPSNAIICISCSQPFSLSNPARLSNCSHTYCESCLKTLECISKIIMDFLIHQQPMDLLLNVESLPINTAIMKLIGQGGGVQTKTNICLLHEKELDLVCVDDGVKVCTNCALFGQHKNHNIKTVESVVEECAIMAQQVMTILTEIEDLETTVSIKALENKIQKSFKERKQILVKQIKAKFYKVIESIRNSEKNCLNELDKALQLQKKTIRNILTISSDQERKKIWINDAQNLIRTVDLSKADQATKYLNPNCSQSGIIKKGEYLIMQLNSFHNSVIDRLKESIEQIIFEMDCSVFDKILSNCYRLQKSKQQRIQLKTQRHDDEFLLQGAEQQYPITPSTIQRHQILQSANSSMYIDIPQLSIDKMLANVQSFIQKSQRKVDRSMIKQPLGISNLDNRKKKKIKIPEKYQHMYDDLKNDRLECVDFTNAELGDSTLIQLTQIIKNSTKLRTLKLVRNKLTDECLPSLIQACSQSRIISLNLGQNGFTDKVLEILQKIHIKDLKNLTLSQNKLNQRTSKAKILEFKKKGITISI